MRSRLLAVAAASALLLSACGGAAGGATGAPPSGASGASTAPAGQATADSQVIFISTQINTVESSDLFNKNVLDRAPVKANFIGQEAGPFNDRVAAEEKSGKVSIGVIGGLHGDFAPFVQAGYMEDLTPLVIKLKDRGFADTMLQLSKYGGDKNYYVPWMQATYLMAANKKALQYLPQGANVDALTYDQLGAWGANIQQATGQRRVGFPAGPKGLMARFFEGYLYPSFTGSAGVVGFKSAEAVAMWQSFKDLWKSVSPQSTSYDFMQDPLQSDEVWVAWDHTGRLIDAAKNKPNDIILFPAPAGPKGRGYLPVVAGLGIPKGTANRAAAEQLIDYLTTPPVQITVLKDQAFFPATSAKASTDLPAGVTLEADAVAKQTTAKDALVSALPIGLGAQGGEFNNIYIDTFKRIVINNEDIPKVLNDQGAKLQAVLDQTKASCWPPDPPSDGPCKVK